MSRINSQRASVLSYLQQGKSITPIEALNLFGCFRLAAVIFNLKEEGHDIKTTIVQEGEKHWASYSLVTPPIQGNLF